MNNKVTEDMINKQVLVVLNNNRQYLEDRKEFLEKELDETNKKLLAINQEIEKRKGDK